MQTRPGGKGQLSSHKHARHVQDCAQKHKGACSLQEVRRAWSKSCIRAFGLQCFQSRLL